MAGIDLAGPWVGGSSRHGPAALWWVGPGVSAVGLVAGAAISYDVVGEVDRLLTARGFGKRTH